MVSPEDKIGDESSRLHAIAVTFIPDPIYWWNVLHFDSLFSFFWLFCFVITYQQSNQYLHWLDRCIVFPTTVKSNLTLHNILCYVNCRNQTITSSEMHPSHRMLIAKLLNWLSVNCLSVVKDKINSSGFSKGVLFVAREIFELPLYLLNRNIKSEVNLNFMSLDAYLTKKQLPNV